MGKNPKRRAQLAELLRKTAPRYGMGKELRASWAAPGKEAAQRTVAGRERTEVAGAKKMTRMEQIRTLTDAQRRVYLQHWDAGMRHGPAFTRAKKA